MILVLLTSILLSILIIPQVLEISKAKKLFDLPNHRKKHDKIVPATGGIGIFLSILSCSFIFIPDLFVDLKFLFVALLLIFMVGVKDDMVEIKALTKLLFQIVVGALIGIAAFSEINILNISLSIAWTVLILNAINFMDGINGLAASVGITILISLFVINPTRPDAIFLIIIVGSYFGFLKYNWGNADIFMGDTGSLILGTFIAYFSVSNLFNTGLNISSNFYQTLGILSLPILDSFRVILTRISRGKSPFNADRLHFHHLFIDCNFQHSTVCGIAISQIILVQFFITNIEYQAVNLLAIPTTYGLYLYLRYIPQEILSKLASMNTFLTSKVMKPMATTLNTLM